MAKNYERLSYCLTFILLWSEYMNHLSQLFGNLEMVRSVWVGFLIVQLFLTHFEGLRVMSLVHMIGVCASTLLKLTSDVTE